MSDPFVVHALSYCLGIGNIQLKGRIKRPWLSILRPETERTYLDHQVRQLRKFHEEPHDAIWDRVPGDGFYDTERLRFKGPRLWRAYELLYPRDTWTLTPEILEMVGMQGIAALWMDCGHWKRGTIRFGGIRTHLQDGDFLLLAQYLVEQGIPCHVENRGATIYGVNITPSRTSDFAAAIRPYVHRSMRNRLSKPRR